MRKKSLFGIYIAIVILTLVIESKIRRSECQGTIACALRLGQGAIWSVAWPALVVVRSSQWFDDQLDRSVLHANAPVDAEWYLSQYPDVLDAVKTGHISAEEHYRTYGYKERRLPANPKFDEETYLRENPDVSAAVQNGQFKSGYEHYILFGRFEARKSSP